MIILEYKFPASYLELTINGLPVLNKRYSGVMSGKQSVNEYLISGENKIQLAILPLSGAMDENSKLPEIDVLIKLVDSKNKEDHLLELSLNGSELKFDFEDKAFVFEETFISHESDISVFLDQIEPIEDKELLYRFCEKLHNAFVSKDQQLLIKLYMLQSKLYAKVYGQSPEYYLKQSLTVHSDYTFKYGMFYPKLTREELYIIPYLDERLHCISRQWPGINVDEIPNNLPDKYIDKSPFIMSKENEQGLNYTEEVSVVSYNKELNLFF